MVRSQVGIQNIVEIGLCCIDAGTAGTASATKRMGKPLSLNLNA